MNVLVQVYLKILQRIEQDQIADASIVPELISVSQGTQGPQALSGSIVFLHHHPNRICDVRTSFMKG